MIDWNIFEGDRRRKTETKENKDKLAKLERWILADAIIPRELATEYIITNNNNKCKKVYECFVFILLKVAGLTQEKKKEKSCVATKDITHKYMCV